MIEIGCSNARPWNDDDYSVDTYEIMLEEGAFGTWTDFVEMDTDYLACGAQVKYTEALGLTGLKLKGCYVYDWGQGQKEYLIYEENDGEWKDQMNVCISG